LPDLPLLTHVELSAVPRPLESGPQASENIHPDHSSITVETRDTSQVFSLLESPIIALDQLAREAESSSLDAPFSVSLHVIEEDSHQVTSILAPHLEKGPIRAVINPFNPMEKNVVCLAIQEDYLREISQRRTQGEQPQEAVGMRALETAIDEARQRQINSVISVLERVGEDNHGQRPQRSASALSRARNWWTITFRNRSTAFWVEFFSFVLMGTFGFIVLCFKMAKRI
jgi:hypothetical protein